MPGWLVASDGPLTLALDITVTEDLKNEGIARELINRIQNLRKSSGFDVTDKISVKIYADGDAEAEIKGALKGFSDYIASQTLSRSIELFPAANGENAETVEWGETEISINVSKTA